ncbi:hypothetical protein PZ61_0200910 [Streptomyces sp. MNU77]|nr:hypothetical protein PZ61_0200910 [Streptomyces sp. MNU77]
MPSAPSAVFHAALPRDMSVAHSRNGPWTLTDVLALPDDPAQRVELVGGQIMMSPASGRFACLQGVLVGVEDVELTLAHLPPPLPSSWLRNGVTGLRVRHDFPLLLLMIRGVVSPVPEASTDR